MPIKKVKAVTSGAIAVRPTPANRERLVRLERPMHPGIRERLKPKKVIDSPQHAVYKGNK